METTTKTITSDAPLSVAESIRQQIEAGTEGYWRLQDFTSLPATAVCQTLSRLTKQGYLQRVGKGLYYRARPTSLGKSLPSQSAIQQLPIPHKSVFPAGMSAANLLGFTTQNPGRGEVATTAASVPRTVIGQETTVYTRRPEAWKSLSVVDAALLDFLRQRGMTSELSPDKTTHKLLAYFQEEGRFERLAGIAVSEPPRVRAMLGAIGQQLEKHPALLTSLRESLNPLSRFDFGNLSELRYAREWQAKEKTI